MRDNYFIEAIHPSERTIGLPIHRHISESIKRRSVLSGTLGAVLSAGTASESTRANKKIAKNANATNIVLTMMARGGVIDAVTARRLGLPSSIVGKSAAVLPYYFGDLEKTLGVDLTEAYNATQQLYGTPGQELASYKAQLDQYAPLIKSGEKSVEDLFSGAQEKQQLANLAPVEAQRLEGAAVRKNAGLEALKQTLNEIDAIQAGKGFTGDTLGTNLTKFGARRNIFRDSATDLNQAKLENAMSEYGVKEANIGQRFQNATLPGTLAESSLRRTALPATTLANRIKLSQQPFGMFNMNPAAFQPVVSPPTVSPNNPFADPLAAVGKVGNSLLTEYLKKKFSTPASPGYTGNPSSANVTPADLAAGSYNFGGGVGAAGAAESGEAFAAADYALGL